MTLLGLGQIFAWGATYYLPAVLATPIAKDTGWPLTWIVGALSLGSLISGLAAPHVGRWIDARGGRPVLASGAIAITLGLLIIASAQHLAIYLAGWAVLGLGMAAGLYDAAFGTLAQLFGQDARRRIAILTLFGGFASTVCWPLTAWLDAQIGWRGTCLAYAALQLGVIGPAYVLLLPRGPMANASAPLSSATRTTGPAADTALRAPANPAADSPPRLPLLLLACSGALASAVGGVVSVHLLAILQDRGLGLAAAVALGALIGPAQVSARIVELLFGQSLHPLWVLLASTVLVLLGTALLLSGVLLPAIAILLYGAGMGVHSIARGTVPLALFGTTRYATVMGRLARPSSIVGALAPTAAAMLWASYGSSATLAIVVLAAAVNLLAAITLLVWKHRYATD